MAEEATLRLDGSVDWRQSTRWHFEPSGFRPLAKETPHGELHPIVSDHLGTSREMFNDQGNMLWAGNFTTRGVLRKTILSVASNDNIDPKVIDCPVRFQGQWYDEETGLCYNFYRHYDAFSAQYATADPIGLAGGFRPQSYCFTPNVQIDPLGLRVKTPKEIGDEGENAVRTKYNIGKKTKITINGRTRFPDGLNSTTITEVNNVKSQSLTAQLKDDIDYATQNGLQFDLYVNQNTYLKGPL